MRIFVLVLFFASFLFGFTKSADYDIEYGWFKELGEARATLDITGQNYHIKIWAKAKGLAKFLSRGREEIYESYGVATPNGYLPTKFVQFKRWSDKAEKTTYLFNHAEKTVQKIKEKYEEGSLIEKSSEPNRYYANNDILSLYFNISDELRSMKPGTHKVYYAVGANPKDGKVDLIIPMGAKLEEIKDAFEGVKAASYVIVYINQPIFSSERGELWIVFDEKNECKRATLKDVILFGDIRGILRE